MTKGILSEILTGSPPEAGTVPDKSVAETLAQVVRTFAVDLIGVELEAVVCGVLQRIKFGSETDPTQIGPWLKALDPNCKVRDDFPAKGAFGGKRDTLLARTIMIQACKSDHGLFIDLIAQNGDDITVSVPKSKAEGFGESVKALGKLGEKTLAKLDAALSGKGTAIPVMLGLHEQFGVKYWKTDDGKAFLDSVCVEAPELKTEE